jgi:hypothetical protein
LSVPGTLGKVASGHNEKTVIEIKIDPMTINQYFFTICNNVMIRDIDLRSTDLNATWGLFSVDTRAKANIYFGWSNDCVIVHLPKFFCKGLNRHFLLL